MIVNTAAANVFCPVTRAASAAHVRIVLLCFSYSFATHHSADYFSLREIKNACITKQVSLLVANLYKKHMYGGLRCGLIRYVVDVHSDAAVLRRVLA